jgi:hypothetical protein
LYAEGTADPERDGRPPVSNESVSRKDTTGSVILEGPAAESMRQLISSRNASADVSRRPRIASVAIVGWLALQISLPVRGLFVRPSDGGGRFSWNMYASNYACRTGYAFHPTQGSPYVVDPESFFSDRRRARRVFHRDALPPFHAWICERLGPGRLEGHVACATDGEPFELLVAPGVDLCAPADADSP